MINPPGGFNMAAILTALNAIQIILIIMICIASTAASIDATLNMFKSGLRLHPHHHCGH